MRMINGTLMWYATRYIWPLAISTMLKQESAADCTDYGAVQLQR